MLHLYNGLLIEFFFFEKIIFIIFNYRNLYNKRLFVGEGGGGGCASEND